MNQILTLTALVGAWFGLMAIASAGGHLTRLRREGMTTSAAALATLKTYPIESVYTVAFLIAVFAGATIQEFNAL